VIELKVKVKKCETIHYTEKKSREWLRLQDQFLSNSMIIGSTLSMLGSSKFDSENKEKEVRAVEYLIVDEACQSNELETLIALGINPERVILVGDEKQLPATVISNNHEQTKFSRSLFERLLENEVEATMLKVQYRMHPSIREFPSNKFYQGQLKDHESNQRR